MIMAMITVMIKALTMMNTINAMMMDMAMVMIVCMKTVTLTMKCIMVAW